MLFDHKELQEEYVRQLREDMKPGQPWMRSKYFPFSDPAEFAAKMTVYGAILGFTLESMGFAHSGKKHYRTLLEDLAEPQKKITVPKTTSLGVLGQRTLVILSKVGKGTVHGALYGYSNYLFRNMGASDNMSLFLSGGVFAVVGRSLCMYHLPTGSLRSFVIIIFLLIMFFM